jgi:deoxyxylulose-5-phosphate synthase
MVTNPIEVITDAIGMSGIGVHALNVSKALNSELISIRKDNKKSVKDYNGIVFSGIKSGRLSSGYYINEKYQDLFYKKCIKYLKEKVGDDTVVHYTTPGIRKFKLKGNIVVTFHDLLPLVN